MPFDPTKPADSAEIIAVELRGQFTALADRLTALELAVNNTAQNPHLSPLSLGLSDPPTRNEVQQLLDAYNALLYQITRV